MGIERLDGETADFNRMQEALQSLPFLASRKLVVLEQAGSNKQFVEKAAELLNELPETTDLVIIEPKLDKRLGYYKLLKKQKGFQECKELDENALGRWLVEGAKRQGATLALQDARYLIDRVGANQQKLAMELEKLCIASITINRGVIDKLTVATPQSTIFQLIETAFTGNLTRTLALYAEQRALKVDPIYLIAMLAWQLHIVALVKAGGTRSPESIAAEAKLSPYVVKKSATIARQLTVAQLRTLINDLTVLDERLKRDSLNPDEAMLGYLTNLAIQ